MSSGGPPAVRAAMIATQTIPIVFGMGEDPVQEGLVASLARPGGNVTGFTTFSNQLLAKRLQVILELVPGATALGFLANPTNPNIGPDMANVQAAANALGLRVQVAPAWPASSKSDDKRLPGLSCRAERARHDASCSTRSQPASVL
jgi:putative ABC transport system substrate-binding protein